MRLKVIKKDDHYLIPEMEERKIKKDFFTINVPDDFFEKLGKTEENSYKEIVADVLVERYNTKKTTEVKKDINLKAKAKFDKIFGFKGWKAW